MLDFEDWTDRSKRDALLFKEVRILIKRVRIRYKWINACVIPNYNRNRKYEGVRTWH